MAEQVLGPDDGPDRAIPWHYGDPLGEQRHASSAAVVIDRGNRGVFTLSGPERLSWLHTVSSQFLTDLGDGESAEDLSLDVNGRVEHHFVLTDVAGTVTVDTEGDRAEALATFLQRMIFWAKVEIDPAPGLRVLTVIGPTAHQVLGLDDDAPIYRAAALPGGGFWRRMPGAIPAYDVVTPSAAGTFESLVAAGARPAGSWTFEALRVLDARPRIGVDTDERTIPHEARWIGGRDLWGAVHLEKGCYRGQETVARVHNLGRPPRMLVLLHLDGSNEARPATGDPVTVNGRAVGRVGTVVDHHEWGPVALALVKRAVVEQIVAEPAGVTPLLAGGVAASIDTDTTSLDTTVPAGRAAIDRLRGRV